MRRIKTMTITALAAALVAGAGLAAAHRWTVAHAAAQTPAVAPVPVVAGDVMRHDVPIYLRGVGTVIAYNTVVVRSQIQGQLTRIAFTEGQAVHAGDLLAEIDPRPFQAQLDQGTATRDRDRAQLVTAQANLKRSTARGAKGWRASSWSTASRRRSRSFKAPSRPMRP